MSIRVIISDVNPIFSGNHGEIVKAAVLAGANGALLDNEIELRYDGFAADIEYAVAVGAVMVVRSTTDVQSYIRKAGKHYRNDDILTVMPLGSNSHIQLFLTPDEVPVIVTTGASDGDNNETGYGYGLEFFDDDNGRGTPASQDLSSFSNGIIAGKLYYIYQQVGQDWWTARWRARLSCSFPNVPNNGFGKIDAEVAPNIEEPPTGDDPYQFVGPVGLVSLNYQAGSTVSLKCAEVKNADTYTLKKSVDGGNNWTDVGTQEGVIFSGILLDADTETQFVYSAANVNNDSNNSAVFSITYTPPPAAPGPPSPAPTVSEVGYLKASIGHRKFL